MSIRIMSQAWDLQLSSTEKLVLLALADCANDAGECWPSIATIGRKACIGERSVQRSIRSLEDAGHLSRREVTGRGCRYLIHPRHSDTPATVAPVTNETPPPPQWHPTPATVAPKPSLNRKEPSNKQTKRAMPDDWQPAPFGIGSKCADLMAQWPPGEAETQFEHFAAHHRAKGSRFMDWQDAWKTWVLNSRKWNNGGSSQRTTSGVNRRAPQKNGIAAALDRRLGFDEPAGEAGRRDFGAGAGHSPLALAAPGTDF